MNIYFERLKKLWESMGYSDANSFAKSLSWDRAEKILRLDREGNEDKKPGIDILRDIAINHPDFDFIFLLTGEKPEKTIEKPTDETEIKTYSCPECIKKQKEIEQLQKEKDAIKDKYIECLEQLANNKGGTHIANSA